VVVSAYRFSHGRSSLIKNMERKRSLSWLTLWKWSCFSLPMRMLGLMPSIPRGRRSNTK
jgi:hypothetical protein